MSHIFISYSRRDLAAAQKIVDALSVQKLETWIDWKSIPKGEDWEQEIYRGIEASEAFLFLISPDSVKSRMCNKELLDAIENNKRILPILLRDTNTSEFLEPTARAEIERLNWVFCRQDQDDFTKAIEAAQTTIRTDYEWVRFHTALQVKALAWERAGKDGSRLLRGKELKETEKVVARSQGIEPLLTETQKQYIVKSRKVVKQRQSLPYEITLAFAAAIFAGFKLFYLVLPITSACPQVTNASVHLEVSDPNMPADLRQRLLDAGESSGFATKMRKCDERVEGVIQVTATYDADADQVKLNVRLPETPAYQLDFLQEIREFNPQLVSEQETLKLLKAFSAYSVGEYQTVIDTLEKEDNLSALTLTAQAQLFMDDLEGSLITYQIAQAAPQPNQEYSGKLYMGAALASWRPESYHELSFKGDTKGCKQAGEYYTRAQNWMESSKLAHNIRTVYAWYCSDENNSDSAGHAEWKQEPPQTESDLTTKDAVATNAIAQYILALGEKEKGDEAAAARALYQNHLVSAQFLMLARADLSEFLWGVKTNCADAKLWRDAYRAGIVSGLEKRKLQKLLQSQPLSCR